MGLAGWANAAAVIVLVAGTTARAADQIGGAEFALGIGYAHESVGGSSSQLHSEGALRFDPCVSFAPFDAVPQLRLGAAFGVSMVLDNTSRTIISNSNGLTINGSSDVPFLLLEPELRLSWRQYFGDGFWFFVEPGIGLGGAIGNYSVSAPDVSFDKWDACFTARALLNVGVPMGAGEFGIQASYAWGGNLDFAQNAGGNLREFYIGVFGSLKF